METLPWGSLAPVETRGLDQPSDPEHTPKYPEVAVSSIPPDKVFYSPTGIPELGIPAGSVVMLWIGVKYSYLVQGGYDHAVIWNHFEAGNLAEVTPGPGLETPMSIALNSPTDRPPSPPEGPTPPSPAPRSGRRATRVLPFRSPRRP